MDFIQLIFWSRTVSGSQSVVWDLQQQHLPKTCWKRTFSGRTETYGTQVGVGDSKLCLMSCLGGNAATRRAPQPDERSNQFNFLTQHPGYTRSPRALQILGHLNIIPARSLSKKLTMAMKNNDTISVSNGSSGLTFARERKPPNFLRSSPTHKGPGGLRPIAHRPGRGCDSPGGRC